MSRLPPRPALVWGEDGAPRAEIFDDVYFSRAGGLEESRAVFLEGCALPARWQGQASHRLCELGFGAGLNALATWALWARTRAPGARLDYVAIEAFPLVRAEAARALAQFSPLGGYADRLLARWPVRAYGPQRLWFPEDGFALTLIVGEVSGALDGLTGQFESWFLDGFAPARNPAMWSEAVARRIAALSAPGAHAASYSVAGAVRRALAAAGFAVEKRPGFAAKRERLEARLSAPPPQPQALYAYAG
ncbi:MAG: tRNA (5-methylaminomethyl-2-thiouridine)(34)-methyltransferase MnmD, partial [Hyphomonadaceae bacterium]